MKILFIQPKSNIKKIHKILQIFEEDQFYYLHTSVYYLASITPLDYQIKIIDERFKKIKDCSEYNLVVISFSAPFSSRAYELCRYFKEKGKIVVLMGPHPSFMPNEAKKNADSVIIGEPDAIWINLLKDAENNKLKECYKADELIDPTDIKRYRFNFTNIFLPERIEASRGCPNCCSFCLAPKILGSTQRKRPIQNVIDDIKSIKNKVIVFDDSSFTNDPGYAKKLFKKLRRLKKRFICCGNVNVLSEDDELLKLAKKAGCIAWYIGFESFNQKTLDAIGKKTNDRLVYKSLVKKIHDHGMAIEGSFIFGFDSDNIDVFDETLKSILELNIDIAAFNILGVYPGTESYQKLDDEQRILTKDWDNYHFFQATFKPKNMSKQELEKGVYNLALEFYSIKNILKRSLKSFKFGYYPFFYVLTKNYLQRQFYKSWIVFYKNYTK